MVVPKVYNGKNKVFWFSHMTNQHSVLQPYTLTVPTGPQLRRLFRPSRGQQQLPDLRSFNGRGGGGRQAAASALPGNIIPAAQFNPIALNYLKYFPAPNQAGLPTGRTTTWQTRSGTTTTSQ